MADQPAGSRVSPTVREDGLTIEALIREHHAVLYRYAFRLTGQECDAEDLTQQTYLTAYRKLHQLRQAAAARGWLFQILRTVFLKICRKKKPDFEADVDVMLQEVAEAVSDDVPFDFERLQQRLDELPVPFRVTLLMYYFEGKSYAEIADELGIRIGTVMSRLSRAKNHLRQRMLTLEATK